MSPWLTVLGKVVKGLATGESPEETGIDVISGVLTEKILTALGIEFIGASMLGEIAVGAAVDLSVQGGKEVVDQVGKAANYLATDPAQKFWGVVETGSPDPISQDILDGNY